MVRCYKVPATNGNPEFASVLKVITALGSSSTVAACG